MNKKHTDTERTLRARYTFRYVFASLIIGAAIVFGAYQVNGLLAVNALKAEVIVTAGDQRMLSQRLALLPDRVTSETNPFRKNRAINDMRTALQRMREGHTFLTQGRPGVEAPATLSAELRHHYSPAGRGLDLMVLSFLTSFEAFLDNPESMRETIEFQRINAENGLIIRLNEAVTLYRQQAEHQMAQAIRVHTTWILVSLLVLIALAVFLFRPMARDAADAVAAIGAELDDRASLLSRSLKIAGMGHWRASNKQADPLWISQELLDLNGMDLQEGYHPLSVLQEGDIIDEGKPAEANIQHLAFIETWETGKPTVARSQFRKPDGNIIDILVHMEAEHDKDGNVVGVVGVIKDDTAEAEADRALLKSYAVIEKKTKDLKEAQRLGKLATWRRQLDSQTVEWDERTFELMGFDPETFDPTVENVRKCYIEEDRDRLIAMSEHVIATGEPQSDTFQVQRGDGSIIDLYMRSTLEPDADGNPVALFGTVQDISKERAAARELEQLAYFDNLTGLANRTLFTRELKRVCQAAQDHEHKAALLLLDLDHFKEVNDTLGHQAGDELLSIIGRRLFNIVTAGSFVARLGGDEFAVIVEDVEEGRDLDTLCDQIIEAVSIPAALSFGRVCTNASIGIANISDQCAEPNKLLRFADLALYASKEAGRGRATYYSTAFSAALSERISMAADIRKALDEKYLEMHYQPLIDIRSGKVGGFEALMRLPAANGGYVPPDQFIPIAESSHLISDLGAFAMHTACMEAKAWVDAGLPARSVAVNVSAAQMWHSDLEHIIDSAITTSGLDAKLLCIELTESVFAADSLDRLEGILTRLKARGISLALDDFGTGYSSLGYLNRLPFDKLKIDRTFVSRAPMCAEKQKLLRGILNLGKGLGLTVVAEGVETEEELSLVSKLGVDTVQGWLFAKALKGEQAVVEAARIEANIALSANKRQSLGSRQGDAVMDVLLRRQG
jgi:diguanylate cyclase (GGDEF)-like protein/PAS domain S-box-containing protein